MLSGVGHLVLSISVCTSVARPREKYACDDLCIPPSLFFRPLQTAGYICLVTVVSVPCSVKNEILISFAMDHVRAEFLPWAEEFVRMGFTFVGTPGTAEYYGSRGVSVTPIFYAFRSSFSPVPQ